MRVQQQLAASIAKRPLGGYAAEGPVASEPVAWAAVALHRAGHAGPADSACRWLAESQSADGSVGVTRSEPAPAWPTALAIYAWTTVAPGRFADPIARALDWGLSVQGETMPRRDNIGHDPSLLGWSWAAATHAWLEPTSFFVRALDAAGHANHPRAQQGRRLLVDRLLPEGGANYGNTMVLGQTLLPHVQPSGIVMWALPTHDAADPRVGKTLDWLEASLAPDLATASLAFASLGLAAHGRGAAKSRPLLLTAAQSLLANNGSLYRRALVLAALNSTPGEG
ncbi:hypothetical protein Pla175_35120 [Pirellulimonas nuda]|uniref:Prenyltransferase and squalene oxidase repeat protein n=1 Tax=Pirellulimonas nuda TaxID=2528009 RepID=A0A518DF99_9BACT|nr:hypothetical protein [Pirellulimonas nuda]QDU90112.1 hypothetical protein Pla175_35120 [Pirellulimonas nuda]